MRAASACSFSSSAMTPSGTWAVTVRYPSALRSSRSASTTSDWSSAMTTNGGGKRVAKSEERRGGGASGTPRRGDESPMETGHYFPDFGGQQEQCIHFL